MNLSLQMIARRSMTPEQLTAWRTRMGLTKGQAAEALGLSLNSWTNYARGWAMVPTKSHPLIKEKVTRPIPTHVALACTMLEGQVARARKDYCFEAWLKSWDAIDITDTPKV